MTDFQSFRNAVLENDDLQDEVMSVVMTATRNGSGLGDGIATLGMKHNSFLPQKKSTPTVTSLAKMVISLTLSWR